jgi:hypothetical protein
MLATTRPSTHTLSFVAPRGDGGRNFWAPERSGDSEEDHALGRAYAAEFLEWLEVHRNSVMVGSIVRAMVAGGVMGAVEAGFCHRLGMELMQP